MTDIDIDTQTTFNPGKYFNVVKASRVHNEDLIAHPCGVYFQEIPTDPITGLAAIPYETAEEIGYTKIDFLHLSLLDHFNSKKEIRALLKIEPNWELLQNADVVSKLFHIHNHFDILYKVKPKSVQDLSDCLALVRPGKRHLVEQYLKDKRATRQILYQKSQDAYTFRHSHSIAYALTIVLQLHLIEAGII